MLHAGGYRRVKRDRTHTEIVAALKAAGRTVVELHRVGGGVPDLLASWPGGVVLLEVKDGKNRLEATQEAFRASWRGPRGSLVVVRSVTEALAATGVRAISRRPTTPTPAAASRGPASTTSR
jgi:hypothetical protein